MMAENAGQELPYGLRRRLTLVFLSLIILFSLLNLFNLIWIGTYYSRISILLKRQNDLHELISLTREGKSELFNYSRSRNDDYLLGSSDRYSRIESIIADEAESVPLKTDDSYRLRDIQAMFETLHQRESDMRTAVLDGISSIYLMDIGDELVRLSDYIIDDLQIVAESFMRNLDEYYRLVERQISRISYVSIILFFSAVIGSIWISRKFVLSISRPIHALALHLVRFGEGDMETRVGEISGPDEIAVLGQSFDKMADRIRSLIHEITDSAELEKKLSEQEAARHEAERLLREAELAHLHAQINPHFLFNTLNTLGSLSVLEEAPRTGRIVADLSELLRYSLRTSAGAVKLGDEVDVLRSYMNIQKLRFEGKITYVEDVDESLLSTTVPGMILQPLAENAVKHGLEPIERNGTLYLSVRKESAILRIELADDGVGISDKAIRMISDKDLDTKSLGIRNVHRRLLLHYGMNVLEIHRRDQGGTCCLLSIPLSEDQRGS